MRNAKLFLRDVISFLIYAALCVFPSTRKNAVLVYHSVGYMDPVKDPWRMNVTPENFEEHLKFISKVKDRVEITFDDGYKNNFTYVYPLLLKYGLTATIFITTDFIDKKIASKEIWNIEEEIAPLSWEDLKIMVSAGIKIGSHGKTHRNLTLLTEKEIEKETTHSGKRIEEMTGIKTVLFCYPIGARGTFNKKTKSILLQRGYKNAYTNVFGLNASPPGDALELKRVRVNTEDGIFRLKMKIAGAYNWVDTFSAIFWQ